MNSRNSRKSYHAFLVMASHAVQSGDFRARWIASSVTRSWAYDLALEASKRVIDNVAKLGGDRVTVCRTAAGLKFSNGAEIHISVPE